MAICACNDRTFMRLGLEIAGFKKWDTYEEHTNVARFRGWYGPSAKICSKIWLDLQSSTFDECRIIVMECFQQETEKEQGHEQQSSKRQEEASTAQ